MTDRCEELLQARLDGELTSAQRAELEQILAGDAAARAARRRARSACRDAESSGAGGSTGPCHPNGHRSHQRDGADGMDIATGHNWRLGMRTKVLWGLAAAAAIVLAVLAYTGFPPETGGSEGAIGAAKRYQAGQIAASDVKLGDQAAQEFLQSDLFDKPDEGRDGRRGAVEPAPLPRRWRTLRSCKAIADTEWRAMLTDASFARALRDPERRPCTELCRLCSRR